jgi:hypothetical protein
VATGLDRSAAAGNGVVPLAAARAWRMLKAAVMAGEASWAAGSSVSDSAGAG